jgi:hypothetical protein
LPVCLQVHHAIADGYHAAQFMTDLQQLASTSTTVSSQLHSFQPAAIVDAVVYDTVFGDGRCRENIR